MRPILISALLASLVAGTALAQTPPAPSAGTPAAVPAAAPAPDNATARPVQPPRPPAPGDMADAGAPPPPPGPGDRRGPPPPPPPGGPHIHLQRGDAVIDVKCADTESTRTCADTAMLMLDRVQPAAKP